MQTSGRVQVGDGLAHRGEHGDDLTRPEVTTAAHHAGELCSSDEIEDERLTAVGERHHRPQGHEMVVLHGEQDLLLGHRLPCRSISSRPR